MMMVYDFLAVLLLAAGLCFAQEDVPAWQITVNGDDVGPGPVFVEEGDNVVLKCRTEPSSGFIVNKQQQTKLISGKSKEEKTISEQGTFDDYYKDKQDSYSFLFEYDPFIVSTFDIKSITPEMDGKYVCEVWRNRASEPEKKAETEVTVVGDVSKVEMKIASKTFEGGNRETGLDLRAGEYQVSCEVSGSNPKPLIHLMIGNQNLAADYTAIEDPESALARRSYTAKMTISLNFDYKMFGKRLSCHGEPELPDSVPKLPGLAAVVRLQGIVDKPTIACSNKTAGVGDRKVTLRCLVSYKPKIKSVAFNVANTKLYPGNVTEDMIEVSSKAFNATFEEVILKFYQVASKHFAWNIYLDVEGYDGKIYQFPVYLVKDTSGASRSAVFVTLTCLLALLLRLL